jgi:hypothetical protein
MFILDMCSLAFICLPCTSCGWVPISGLVLLLHRVFLLFDKLIKLIGFHIAYRRMSSLCGCENEDESSIRKSPPNFGSS